MKRRLVRWSQRLSRVGRWVGGLSGFALAAMSAIYPASSALPSVLGLVLLLSMAGIMSAPLLFAVSQLLRLTWGRAARASASRAGLLVTRGGTSRVTPTADIALGAVLPRTRGAELCLTLTDGDQVALHMDSVVAAEALLAALELDPDQRRTEVAWNPLRRRVGGGVVGFVGSLVLFTSLIGVVGETELAVPLAFLMVCVPFLAAGAGARAVARSVSVGRDGVRARDALTRVEVDFEDVTEVRVQGTQLRFARANQLPLQVSLADLDPSWRELVLERIQQARARYAERVGSRAEPFARGARALEEWRGELRTLLTRDAGFRGAALRRDDALRVVEDPNAALDARVGAALALMGSATEGERLRVRVAADTSVHPKVRIALEAALEGEVEEELLDAQPTEQKERAL